MPDSQQRARAAASAENKSNADGPSTGRRGSHPHADAAPANRASRKRRALRESTTPIEQGGPAAAE